MNRLIDWVSPFSPAAAVKDLDLCVFHTGARPSRDSERRKRGIRFVGYFTQF